MENVNINIKLSAFEEAEFRKDKNGDTIMLVNLDRTPGINKSASGEYYLDLVGWKFEKASPYGQTHGVSRFISNKYREETGEDRLFPFVGSISEFKPKKAKGEGIGIDVNGIDWDKAAGRAGNMVIEGTGRKRPRKNKITMHY